MEQKIYNEAERIDFLVRACENDNAVRFAEKTGIDTTILSRMRSGKLRIGKKIDQICKAYPLVSRDWLETGDGYAGDLNMEMVRDRFLRICRIKDEMIETLRKEIELQQRVIERLMEKK